MKKYHLKRRTIQKNSEGGTADAYAEAIEIQAIIWPAGGRVQAEMYGERLSYIKNMEYEGTETMQEGDGICVFVGPEERPDYKIISIKPEYSPKLIELEKL
nr:hypothetical protein [uncultured Lachnoclostridium sp.]